MIDTIIDINDCEVCAGDTVAFIVKVKGGDVLRISNVHKVNNNSVTVDAYNCFGNKLEGYTQISKYPRFVRVW